MTLTKRKFYTVRKTLLCDSGYGIFECEDENKCTLIACTYTSPLSTKLIYTPP